nr:restriction endonuclease subunit S [uncultured Prevotella sp.]
MESSLFHAAKGGVRMREGWEYKRWADVLTIINGKNQKDVENPNGQYPIYGSGGIMGYALDWLCPENCVIIGRKGNINKPLFVESKFWNVDTAFGLSVDQEWLIPKYLFYFCLDYNFERHNRAVTIPSLTKIDLLKIKMPVPPKSTQLSIVSELDKLNELIRIKKKQLKDYDALAQSIFYEMFGDPVENEKGWEVKKLGNVCKTSSGGTPSKSHDEYYNGDILWLRSGEVGQGDIYDTEQTITLLGLENSSAKIFPVNTVVIAMYGATVGQVGILRKEMSTNQAICGILPNDVLTPEFLNYFLLRMKSEFLKLAIGGAQANISQQIIRKTLIPLPPLSLQKNFTCRIKQIEQQKAAIQKTITDLETLLAARMQYWFD